MAGLRASVPQLLRWVCEMRILCPLTKMFVSTWGRMSLCSRGYLCLKPFWMSSAPGSWLRSAFFCQPHVWRHRSAFRAGSAPFFCCCVGSALSPAHSFLPSPWHRMHVCTSADFRLSFPAVSPPFLTGMPPPARGGALMKASGAASPERFTLERVFCGSMWRTAMLDVKLLGHVCVPRVLTLLRCVLCWWRSLRPG